MALQKRPAPVGMGSTISPPWDDRDFKADYPALFAFLYDQNYSDGSGRIQGSMSIFVTGHSLKFAINDKDRGCVAFVTAPTWTEALTLIDSGIATDSLDWKAASKNVPGKNPPF